MVSSVRLTLVAAAAAGGVGELLRRRRQSAQRQSLPPLTTQSSPGQIAELQQAYGADMAPESTSTGDATATG